MLFYPIGTISGCFHESGRQESMRWLAGLGWVAVGLVWVGLGWLGYSWVGVVGWLVSRSVDRCSLIVWFLAFAKSCLFSRRVCRHP